MIYLKIVRREVTPRNKAHVGGLVEEEREGPEKRARGAGQRPVPGGQEWWWWWGWGREKEVDKGYFLKREHRTWPEGALSGYS